ncbi:MAG: isoleucine--tRNA ligase, partial [Opitutales bacterium]
MANALKDTLNLPQTKFPMRANLVEREPERLCHWEDSRLYDRLMERNAKGESFILHDGPPFTNGDVHVGTALNKTLKDVIVRYKNARGYRVPYVPGWDCHGLPIEHKVTKSLRDAGKVADVLQLRQACKEFSEGFIERQRTQFKRLGILADWAREYRTMAPAYEATILRTFAEFVEKGLVYRSKKPVYWSIPCRTALAEAEVEYKDHLSPAVHVRFKVQSSGDFDVGQNAFVPIWTTTPWTLPANLAIVVHPRETYREVKSNGDSYWIAAVLAESFAKTCGLEQMEFGRELPGEALTEWITTHPFIDRQSPILSADYVTMDAGTGCVHTAPGHGLDDYITGRAHGLEAYCPLDDDGKYLDDGQVPASLVGLSVLSTQRGCPANDGVLSLLEASNSLLHVEQHLHQYPHCWRSKTPVVFRAMDQWFVSLDKDGMREAALEAIEKVDFTPDWGRSRIRGFLEARPDWCISRQRSWGVPIPVFHDEDGEALLDAGIVRGIAEKVEKSGTDLWFEASEDELLEGIPLPEEWQGKTLRKSTDTLDVWIDSGCSHKAVLQREDILKWPADLYLEGSDQHRGWFQSSLWTSMIADGRPPYLKLVTHGFVVDGDGRKISKSDGKSQTADSYIARFGADVLRLWVCSEDFRNDIPLSEEIFKQVTQIYRSLRNTLRFQLGNLYDFKRERDGVP